MWSSFVADENVVAVVCRGMVLGQEGGRPFSCRGGIGISSFGALRELAWVGVAGDGINGGVCVETRSEQPGRPLGNTDGSG